MSFDTKADDGGHMLNALARIVRGTEGNMGPNWNARLAERLDAAADEIFQLAGVRGESLANARAYVGDEWVTDLLNCLYPGSELEARRANIT